MIERLGCIGRAPERLAYRDFKLERKGFLSLFSFSLEGAKHRFDGLARAAAVVVLPADFARRELYMVRQIRPLKPLVSFVGGQKTLRKLIERNGSANLEVEAEHAYVYELPAGMIDGNESPEDAAIRELLEETGLAIAPARLRRVASAFPSIGGTTELVHLFVADLPETHARTRRKALGDGGETLEILKMGWNDAFKLMEENTLGVSTGLLLRELKLLDRRDGAG